jgi:hypothetical protein
MFGDAKAAVLMSAASVKRSKVLGGVTFSVGLFVCVVGLLNALAGNRDIVDILLLVGGSLISLAGLRLLRRVHAN